MTTANKTNANANAGIGHNGAPVEPARVAARTSLVALMAKADKAAGMATAGIRTYCESVADTLGTDWINLDTGKAEIAALVAVAKAKNYGGLDKNGKKGNGAYVLSSRVKAMATALHVTAIQTVAANAAHTLAIAANAADKKVAEAAVKVAEAAVKALAPAPAKKKGEKGATTPDIKQVTPESNAMIAAIALGKFLVVKRDEATTAFSNANRVTLSKLAEQIAAFLAATA